MMCSNSGTLADWDTAVQKTETRLNRINEQRAKVGAYDGPTVSLYYCAPAHRADALFACGCVWLTFLCSSHLSGGRERNQPGASRGGENGAAAEGQGRKEGPEESPEDKSRRGEEKSRAR